MRSAPKDTGVPRQLWAWVGSTGGVAGGNAGLRVVRTGTGAYTVTFDRPPTGAFCPVVTANYGGAAFAVVSSQGAGAGSFTVNTYAAGGASVDSSFDILVSY